MKISRILTLIVIAALVFVIASCGAETVDTDVPTTNENPTESTETTSTAATEPAETEPDEPRVEKFDIYYNEEMNVGETQKITFDVVLSGEWPDIIEETPFKSSDESILVIDKDGNATALSTGTVTVTVSYQTAQKSVEITVYNDESTEKDVQIFVDYDEEMNVGETQQFFITYTLHTNWSKPKFVSSDDSVLTVDENGTVTALSVGTATVTIYYKTVIKSVEITVCGFEPRPDNPYVKKPVIYLYPTEPADITLTFKNDENLITTYPKYNGAWSVHAYPDGTLTDENGRQYYALFFDEARTYYVDFSSGFYVTAGDAIPFLEEKLALLGFTEREADEFIMFWLPIIEQNGQSVVYFEQTAERSAECPLDVSPAPESVLRVIIHIKKVDAPVDIAPQTLVPFERHGFTLVEWGGTEY